MESTLFQYYREILNLYEDPRKDNTHINVAPKFFWCQLRNKHKTEASGDAIIKSSIRQLLLFYCSCFKY